MFSKFASFIVLACSLSSALSVPIYRREVPQEHSHEQILTVVKASLLLNNPDQIQDPVFGLLGNAAAAEGQGKITDTTCLQQATADQAFSNAKAAKDVKGQTAALIYRALERNTGAVGQVSDPCTSIKAVNPEIAALQQHQDPASKDAAAVNKAITLELAKQIASIGGDPNNALLAGTFAPGEIGDPTGAGNTCDDANDPIGCIFTQKLIVNDATPDEIKAAVAGAGEGAEGAATASGEAKATKSVDKAAGEAKATKSANEAKATATESASKAAGEAKATKSANEASATATGEAEATKSASEAAATATASAGENCPPPVTVTKTVAETTITAAPSGTGAAAEAVRTVTVTVNAGNRGGLRGAGANKGGANKGAGAKGANGAGANKGAGHAGKGNAGAGKGAAKGEAASSTEAATATATEAKTAEPSKATDESKTAAASSASASASGSLAVPVAAPSLPAGKKNAD